MRLHSIQVVLAAGTISCTTVERSDVPIPRDVPMVDVLTAVDIPSALDAPTVDVASAVDVPNPRPDTGVCPMGTMACAMGGCTDLQSDNMNCGECGTQCQLGRTCQAGRCNCSVGTSLCGAACANTMTDTTNCGSCGNACPANQMCVSGACRLGCPMPNSICGAGAMMTCVNISSDASHCGACGNVCVLANASPFCVSGMCGVAACNIGFGNCDMNAANGCESNTNTSVSHCGGCGVVCPVVANGTAICTLGVCSATCLEGFDLIGGQCVPRVVQRSCPNPMERGCGLTSVTGASFSLGEGAPAQRAVPVQARISVSDFAIDTHEVTVARFRRFWVAGHPEPIAPIVYPRGSINWAGAVQEPLAPPQYGGLCNWSAVAGMLEQHPLNCVTWWTAQAFCVWDGGRLPTEAEWEFVARGRMIPNVPLPRSFPWGNETPLGSAMVPCDRAHFNRCPGEFGSTNLRVGSFAAVGGVSDMAGSVWEWVADSYMAYADVRCWGGVAQLNPLCNVNTPEGRTVRGASWLNPEVDLLRSASRGYDSPTVAYEGVGFRCVR